MSPPLCPRHVPSGAAPTQKVPGGSLCLSQRGGRGWLRGVPVPSMSPLSTQGWLRTVPGMSLSPRCPLSAPGGGSALSLSPRCPLSLPGGGSALSQDCPCPLVSPVTAWGWLSAVPGLSLSPITPSVTVPVSPVLEVLVFGRDAATAEAWLASREPLARAPELGSSLAEAETLLKRHQSFQKAAAAWDERFAALSRLTTVGTRGGTMGTRGGNGERGMGITWGKKWRKMGEYGGK